MEPLAELLKKKLSEQSDEELNRKWDELDSEYDNTTDKVMTNEEKELLLQDLCCRLPYGVMVHAEHDWFEDEVPPYDALLTVECHSILNNFSKNPLTCCFIIKPYLRPMSSMTDDERLELSCLSNDKFKFYLYTKEPEIICYEKYNYLEGLKIFDWLNAHHFDYRGLIEKGLALEATDGMYNLKNQ